MKTTPAAITAAPIALALLLLAGCATPAGPGGDGVPVPQGPFAADRLVSGQGTVIQVGDAPPELCLGAVAESYPPQCSGPEIVGWDWAPIEVKESSGDVTWGAFFVVGEWDGERFTVQESPIPVALYDPAMQEPDPRTDPAHPGELTDAEGEAIHTELLELGAFEQLTSWSENGYLFVTVVFDPGSIQEYVDAQYGPDRVAILSALQLVD